METPAGREEWPRPVPEKEEAEEDSEVLADAGAEWQEIAAIAETFWGLKEAAADSVSFKWARQQESG